MSSSDCEETSLEFEVFPLTPIETNVVEEYVLCNGNLSVDFDILNPENFSYYQWSNINVGNNIVEYEIMRVNGSNYSGLVIIYLLR